MPGGKKKHEVTITTAHASPYESTSSEARRISRMPLHPHWQQDLMTHISAEKQ